MDKYKKFILDNTDSHHEYLMNLLRDSKEASTYLTVALEEYRQTGNTEFFLLALRNLAEAQGGVGQLAKKTNLNRQSLYHMLSIRGNPSFLTLEKVLKALGFCFYLEPLDASGYESKRSGARALRLASK